MQLKKFKIILLSALGLPIFSADHNPEYDPGYQYIAPTIQGDIDQFSDEKVVVLYRGVNFVTEKFSTQERQTYIRESHIGQGMFCSAAYEKAGLIYGDDNFDALTIHAQDVAHVVNGLSDYGEITINGMVFSNHRYAFQNLYSNNCKKFFEQMDAPNGEYEPVFENFDFIGNSLLSFSDRVKHPGKYGYGIKNFGDCTPLLPQYDINGCPRHPILGKLFGVILDEAAVEELQPMNVRLAHNRREIRLYDHFRNNILSEREIAIAGYVPGESVVFEMPLSVPSFNGAYKSYYKTKYGLSKTKFNNFSRFFKSAIHTPGQRVEKEKDLLNGLIEAPYQDSGLVYQNCLGEKITRLFDNELTHIDAHVGTLTLDYTIQ